MTDSAGAGQRRAEGEIGTSECKHACDAGVGAVSRAEDGRLSYICKHCGHNIQTQYYFHAQRSDERTAPAPASPCEHEWTFLGTDPEWKYCRICRVPFHEPEHPPSSETTAQHIARDIREGRFPQRSAPLVAVGVTDEDDDTLIDNMLWAYATTGMPRYDEFRAELKKRLAKPEQPPVTAKELREIAFRVAGEGGLEPEAVTEMRGAGDRYVLCLNADRMRQVVAYVDALGGALKAAKAFVEWYDATDVELWPVEGNTALEALRSKLAALEEL